MQLIAFKIITNLKIWFNINHPLLRTFGDTASHRLRYMPQLATNQDFKLLPNISCHYTIPTFRLGAVQVTIDKTGTEKISSNAIASYLKEGQH